MIEGYYIVQLMGHVKHVGFLTEVEVLGGKLGKVDAIQRDGSIVSHLFGAAAVYQLTPSDEATCKQLAKPYEYTTYRSLPVATEDPYCSECCAQLPDHEEDCSKALGYQPRTQQDTSREDAAVSAKRKEFVLRWARSLVPQERFPGYSAEDELPSCHVHLTKEAFELVIDALGQVSEFVCVDGDPGDGLGCSYSEIDDQREPDGSLRIYVDRSELPTIQGITPYNVADYRSSSESWVDEFVAEFTRRRTEPAPYGTDADVEILGNQQLIDGRGSE